MFEITIEQLLELCRYGTDIRIVRSDNGGTVIERLSSLANSKDKRQVAKWEAFRKMPVHGIYPDIQMGALSHRVSDHIPFGITASILPSDYSAAMEKIKKG